MASKCETCLQTPELIFGVWVPHRPGECRILTTVRVTYSDEPGVELELPVTYAPNTHAPTHGVTR